MLLIGVLVTFQSLSEGKPDSTPSPLPTPSGSRAPGSRAWQCPEPAPFCRRKIDAILDQVLTKKYSKS